MVSEQKTLEISNWDGSLSAGGFYFAACAFLVKWNRLGFNSHLPRYWDGSLSAGGFYFAACAFLVKWNRLGFNSHLPRWSWTRCSNGLGFGSQKVDGYLSIQDVLFHRRLEEEQDEGGMNTKQVPSSSDIEDPFDAAVLVESNDHEVHHYDFHVVYSLSYRVPVLYFRAYSYDGQLLSLNEIKKDLPTISAKVLMESKCTFMTQEEHLYLNRPWYTLHHCGTSEWMKLLLSPVRLNVDLNRINIWCHGSR